MNIFRILTNGILKKKDVEGYIEKINLSSPVVELKRAAPYEFSSDHIVSISDDGVLDADDPINIARYKSNLKVLMEEALKKGVIDKFFVIREDDIFPYDWRWRVASSSTSGEYGKSNLTYEIRMAKAEEALGVNQKNSFINVPVNNQALYEEARKLGPMYGTIYMPTHFRSTKHFTVNTPLGYTGSYNSGIEAGRNFIVIDDASNFLNSHYGYSIDYMDAYMDITHEELPISENAIVLVSEEKYDEIIHNSEIKSQLGDRRVIVFRGNESVAINMVLSEMGVLPSRPGLGVEYSGEVQYVLESSMRNLAESHELEYSHSHGNINGEGGHFSDLYDSEYPRDADFEYRFVKYMKNYFFEYADLIDESILTRPHDIVRKIGPDKLNGAILLFNDIEKKRIASARKKYDSERDLLTAAERLLFQDTLKLIRKFYSSEYVADADIKDSIRRFYHSSDVGVQVTVAETVNCYIREKLSLDGNYSI